MAASFSALKSAIFDREERKLHYQTHIRGLNAYDRHKKFLNDYVKYYGKERPAEQRLPVKTDQDALREGYRFIRTEEDDMGTSWEQRLVQRYYDKLFKEYCIADMSKYRSGKIGLRWRAEKEVISGKGQFICGNKHCDEKNGLASYEVNFSYIEAGESKQALVKLVACERCAEKLQYRRKREKLENKEKEVYDKKWKMPRNDSETDDEDKRSAVVKRLRSEMPEHMEKGRSGICWKSSPGGNIASEKPEREKERERKGKCGSVSGGNPDHEDDEGFEEFLEGMFP